MDPEGDRPLRTRHDGDLVVATAGTVSTGAVDAVGELAAIAHEHGAWLHVDGAYGAPAALLDDPPAGLRELHEADSVAIDPHEWLYVPLEAGCILVRDPDSLAATFGYVPPYHHFEETDEPKTNFYELGLQNSRGFRALKVWLAIRQAGRSGLARMITDDVELAAEAHRSIEAHPELEVMTLGLSIWTFRFVPADLPRGEPAAEAYLDEFNEELLTRLEASGEAFLSNAEVRGRKVLRGCIVNFRTTVEDVRALPEIVVRHGRAADRAIRPLALRPAGA